MSARHILAEYCCRTSLAADVDATPMSCILHFRGSNVVPSGGGERYLHTM